MFSRGERNDFEFNYGGRLYCRSEGNWQNLSSKERVAITWNGERTVEIDINSSHIVILYALHPRYAVPSGDHYAIDNVEREVAKGLITAFLGNGKAPVRWPKEMAQRYFKRTGRKIGRVYKVANVISAVLDRHPVLGEVQPYSMDWGKLQYLESECFVETLLQLGRSHGISALPVHDSLIVAERHGEVAKYELIKAYQQRFGITPEVRVTSGQDLLN